MKFIHYLETITGVGIFPLSSLAIFLVFFLVVATHALKADKGHIDIMKQIPVAESENE